MTLRLPVLAVIVCAATAAAATQFVLDPRAVNEAIALGQTRVARELARFHEPYRLSVQRPPVDFVDVITPFRAIVLTSEARARAGDRSFGQRQAFELLDAAPMELELRAEFSFHPLNTFVGVPPYEVALVDARGRRLEPRTTESIPRYGARVEGSPPPLPVPGGLAGRTDSQPMLGGTVIARFDGRNLDAAAVYDVVVAEGGKELARVRADLGRLR